MGFELVGSGQLENRRNLRPDCWLYLLISLSSVGLLGLTNQDLKEFF